MKKVLLQEGHYLLVGEGKFRDFSAAEVLGA